MSGNNLVAVVSGSNKGIGFAIVRGLCKQFKGDVFLTARNEDLGLKAVADLEKEGLHPKFHILDITKPKTIADLKTFLEDKYGGLDLLVNNAGVAYKGASTAPFAEQAEVSVRTNFTGTLDVCEALFPILRPHARVVNVSSMVAPMGLKKCSANLRKQFVDPNLSMAALKVLMQEFVDATKTDSHQTAGWPNTAYGTSKIGVTTMSLIQQRELLKDTRPDLVVNACCPGYVDTDMTSHKGTKTIDQGADTPLYLAMLPPDTISPKGNHVSERKIDNWE
ncbi:carbonyl reductase [NADPH] 1-like [Mizuhopecten yessoensis]|uniref:carbonyl reductase (NADPH) n=1 Tax=Mizuhopecten yessoensis TaxID=6573 RepID=A0A210QR67_MIZYE|nr:carbonyl reductase [NADPH] 1-like [Mizuhopecten yessoensis]OWF51188.1 Carbonyl reductase [NADPH] 1 [Mizuhopecten yessoensis]